MHVPIYQILYGVDTLRGGMTRVVLRRSRLLAARTSEQVHILTLDFNPDYDRIRQDLTKMRLIDDGVVIHNLFEDLAPVDTCGPGVVASQAVEEPGFVVVPAGADGTFRVLDGDVAVRHKVYSPEGRLIRVDHLDEHGRTASVDHFDALCRVRRVETHDPATGLTLETLFFHADGRPYVKIECDPETGGETSVSLLDPDSPNTVIRSYSNQAELRVEWLETYAHRHDLSIFMSDYRNGDRLIVKLDGKRVVRVKTLHTNHLETPYVYGSPLRPRARIELGKANSYDALVFLSHRQCDDVERQFGPRTIYHVVNNPAPPPGDTHGVQRDPYKAVGVGRYHSLKRWDYTIEAFRTVVDAVPEATLELWGFGPAQTKLQAQIEELGLDEHVFLRGMSHNPAKVFASAAFSVLSSPSEGFPLVPLESMAEGTPVIAFDVNYGLADQIRSGVDGILVERGDTQGLAEAMIELFTDHEKREAMGREARHITDRLSEPAYVDAWIDVLESALDQHGRRVDMEPPRASVSAIRITADRLTLEGTVEFDEMPPDLEMSLYVRSREPMSTDEYYAIETTPQTGNPELLFTVSVPLADLATPGATWDPSVSCSARNAHFFARIGVDPRLPLAERHSSTSVFKPYRTQNGNLSIRVGQYHSLATRAVRRFARLFGASSPALKSR